MLFLFWKRRGVRVWGALVVYNALGAFHRSQGLVTQFLSSMPARLATPAQVYVGIGLFMGLQVAAVALLFRRGVVSHFRN